MPYTGGHALETGDEEIFQVVQVKSEPSCNWNHWASILMARDVQFL